jgi:hypothetical protein
MQSLPENLRIVFYKALVVAGALTLCVGVSYAATSIGTNISTDGTLNVGGDFGIASSSPGSLFSVGGITNFTTATSTFYSTGGINLTGGCYAVNGTCVGGGGGGTTPSPLPFFGTQTSKSWVRPGLAQFNSWLNQVDAIGGGTQPTTATATDYAVTLSTPGLPLVADFGINNTAPNGLFPSGLLKSIGAPPWTITTAQAFFFNSPSSLSIVFPIILYDSADQKMETVEFNTYGGCSVYQWTDVNDLTTIANTEVDSGVFSLDWPSYFAWFRVQNDGTNLTYSISPDGLIFKVIYSEPVGSFLGTIDKVGFGVDRAKAHVDTAGFSSASEILWSWVETSS